ncbi:MAG: crossover junction endodeoxyribonuclease RuvC [Bacteroidota bacterium]
MANRIILGIDPGTQITGYGLISCKGKQMTLLTYGVIRLDKQAASHPDKLKKIFNRVNSLVQEFKPQELAIEAPFHGKNVQSMLKLGRAQGVAMAAGLVNGVEIFEYAPRKIKQAVTGNGTASKLMVSKTLEQLLNFTAEEKYMDATDGLAVAVCHFFQLRLPGAGNRVPAKDWTAFINQNPDRVKKKRK